MTSQKLYLHHLVCDKELQNGIFCFVFKFILRGVVLRLAEERGDTTSISSILLVSGQAVRRSPSWSHWRPGLEANQAFLLPLSMEPTCQALLEFTSA